jgi:polyisoprenyl-phosphate glycosyltransferase
VSRPRLSIIVPVYYNELNLPETIPHLRALAGSLPGYELELVCVDDGSKDASLRLLEEHQAQGPGGMTIVKLTRNFGTMGALQAGLMHATGDCVGMISADLQDPPELFLEMVRRWEQGNKVVLAVRADRDEPLSQRLFANAYYALVRRFALPGYPEGGFDFFLVDRQVVLDLNRICEKNTNLMSLIFWLGYEPVMLPYVRRRRTKGKSRWTLAKKVKLVVDSFIGFSYAPVRLMSVVGFVTAASAFIYAAYVFLLWSVQGVPVRGYAPIVILIALTSGIQMLMLGVVGEYLWRMLDEVRRRPPYVVDWVRSAEGQATQNEAAAAQATYASRSGG